MRGSSSEVAARARVGSAPSAQTIERLREVERRARAEWSSPTRQRTILAQPVRDHNAWSLVCMLVRSPDPVPFGVALHVTHPTRRRAWASALVGDVLREASQRQFPP